MKSANIVMNTLLNLTTKLCCPNCRGSLDLENGYCEYCQISFPKTLEIFDLRWPFPTGANRKEAALTAVLLERYQKATFKELLELRFVNYGAPEPIKAVYRDYHSTFIDRGQRMLDMFAQRMNDYNYELPGYEVALDLGCGIGASSVTLATRFKLVIGLDPFLPNLILGQKLIQERGIKNIVFVQGYAQNLPLRSNILDYAVAQNVIEHLFDVEPAFLELRRTLKTKGCFCGDSRNRFDLFLPEPHAQLRWVGFWPRKLQPWYVYRFKGKKYSTAYLLSLSELKRSAQQTLGRSTRVMFSLGAAYGRSSKWDNLLKKIETIPLLSDVGLFFYPSHTLIAQIG